MINFLVKFSDLLEQYGDVHYMDLPRDTNGFAKVDDIEIVYDLSGGVSRYANDTRQDITLIVDIWGNKSRVFDIEFVVSELEKVHRCKFDCEDGIYLVDRDNLFRNNLGDEDKNIMRIRLQYLVRKLN